MRYPPRRTGLARFVAAVVLALSITLVSVLLVTLWAVETRVVHPNLPTLAWPPGTGYVLAGLGALLLAWQVASYVVPREEGAGGTATRARHPLLGMARRARTKEPTPVVPESGWTEATWNALLREDTEPAPSTTVTPVTPSTTPPLPTPALPLASVGARGGESGLRPAAPKAEADVPVRLVPVIRSLAQAMEADLRASRDRAEQVGPHLTRLLEEIHRLEVELQTR